MSFFTMAACLAVSYFLGNIQTGILVGRLTNNIDLRSHGSGSSGATNALRILGRQSALQTFAGDCLKGIIAVCFGLLIGGQNGGMLAGLSVIAGHIWPVLFHFKGGKGVATSIGVILCLAPLSYALIAIIAGIGVFLLTRTVSLASITIIGLYAVLRIIGAVLSGQWGSFLFAVVMAALVLYAHRENIERLKKGTEGRITREMFERK